MSNPRTGMDASGPGTIQDYFAWFGDSADSTVWMGEEEQTDIDAIGELIFSGELSLSAGQAGN